MNKSTSKPSTSAGNSGSGKDGDERDDKRGTERPFECNICLEMAKNAVVSLCGHLFCWPCLLKWLETRPNKQVCPVCKSAISKDKVVPVYGRDSSTQEDPRQKLPPRPQGQRSEPEATSGFPGLTFADGGVQFSLGIGTFPFGFVTSFFGLNTPPRHEIANLDSTEGETFLSRTFIFMAVIILTWLLSA